MRTTWEDSFVHEFSQFASNDIVGAEIGKIVAHEDIHPPRAADALGDAFSDGSGLPNHDKHTTYGMQ
jgi:hypothetical protein